MLERVGLDDAGRDRVDADAEMIRGQTLVIDGGWSLPAG
jgi:hypothetical protein